MDGPNPKIKSDHHLLLIPNIPFFHYSRGHLAAKTTPLCELQALRAESWGEIKA
jgi:hypothetical protein